MSNETPSERSDWRERLDQPVEAWTGREAAWDKLYDRLHQKENISRRKRYPVYWAAAAAALLVIGLGIVHERQHGEGVASPDQQAAASPTVAGNGQPAGNEQAAENEQPGSNETPAENEQPGSNDQPAGDEQPGNNEHPLANGHPIQQRITGTSRPKVYANEPPSHQLPTPIQAENPAPVVPEPTVAGLRPVAPPAIAQSPLQGARPRAVTARLPVVSINELGTDEPAQSGGGSKSSNDHYLQIKLINEQTYTETASENGRHSTNRLGLNIHR